MSAPSKLNPDQWRELAALVTSGSTLKDAREYCLTQWGVQISQPSIHSNPGIKSAVRTRRIMQRIQAGEALQDTLPGVTQTIVDRMADLAKEAKEIRSLAKDPSAPHYRTAMQRLASIDSALAGYLKPYRDILDWVQTEDGPTEDKPEKSAAEYLKTLDNLLKDKTGSPN